MHGFQSRLTSIISDLEGRSGIEVIGSDMTGPTPRAELDFAAEQANGHLPVGVEDFYREVGSFRLEWRHAVPGARREGKSDGGSINILPIRQVFADWRGVTWFPSQGSQGEEFRPVKPFDMFTPEACTSFLQPLGGSPSDSVAYHYFGEELHETGYTFNEYLERLFASRGYWYWPLTLCSGLEGKAEVAAFRKVMPTIFPDYDDTIFRPRPIAH